MIISNNGQQFDNKSFKSSAQDLESETSSRHLDTPKQINR